MGDHGMIISPQWLTVALKTAAGVVFLNAYLKSKRKSALFLSLGWISSILVSPPSTSLYPGVECIFTGMAAAFTLTGILTLIEEEGGRRSPRAMHLTLPTLPAVYGVIEASFNGSCTGTYITSGVLLLIAGVIFTELMSTYYRRNATLFGVVLGVSGVASMLHPIAYENGLLTPDVVMYNSLVIATMAAYAYYRVIYSRHFLGFENLVPGHGVDAIAQGAGIMSERDFRELAPRLDGFPVLAFLRNSEPMNGWLSYRISTVQGANVIPPTSMYRITETTNMYLREMEKVGNRGIVIIEAVEFLKLYNDFRSVVKMLATLRDSVLIHGGTLIIVTEKDVWDEGEWNILLRTLE